MTVTALEGEALRLLDSAVERLELAVTAVRSADPGLARDVVEDCRRGQEAAHGLSASVLALFADGPLGAFASCDALPPWSMSSPGSGTLTPRWRPLPASARRPTRQQSRRLTPSGPWS